MALVSGTANLLETCKSYDVTDKTFNNFKFDHPVAHSSPFIGTSSVSNFASSAPKSELQSKFTRLVDYSTSVGHSLEEKLTSSNKSSSCGSKNGKSNYLRNKTHHSSIESSKSLDDLRLLNLARKYTKSSAVRSYSSNSVFHSLNLKTLGDKNPSSSSAATVVSRSEKNHVEPKYSSKGVQVDEALLDLRVSVDESAAPKKSDLEFLRNLYLKSDKSQSSNTDDGEHPSSSSQDKSEEVVKKSDNNVGSINGGSKSEEGSGKNGSNVGSLDGGSFEYVPGSVFDEDRLNRNSRSGENKSSSSEVNTSCSEVVDGLDLITKYVDNLRVNNKRKIIKKMAQFLINNVANEENRQKYSKEASIQCTLRGSVSSSLFVNSSPDMAARNQPTSSVSNLENALSGNDSKLEFGVIKFVSPYSFVPNWANQERIYGIRSCSGGSQEPLFAVS